MNLADRTIIHFLDESLEKRFLNGDVTTLEYASWLKCIRAFEDQLEGENQ